MRVIWLALVAVVLGGGSMSQAQEVRAKKAKRRAGDVWAVAHEEPAPPGQAQPLAPPVSLAPPLTDAPAVAHPLTPAEHPHAPCPADGGRAGPRARLQAKCAAVWDWLCFRRSRDCCKGCGCGYYCSRPLYLYFLDHCREGACWSTQCTGPACGQAGYWTRPFAVGHAMFAMPTGPGVVGIR